MADTDSADGAGSPSDDRMPVPVADARVVVVVKPGCQLCADAVSVVERVCGEEAATWAQVDATTQPALADAYYYEIPVIFVDGRRHDYYRVDSERLRSALRGAGA